jgi:hypothetical protein
MKHNGLGCGARQAKRRWHESQRYISEERAGEPSPYKKPSPYGVRRQEGGVTLCDAQGKKPPLREPNPRAHTQHRRVGHPGKNQEQAQEHRTAIIARNWRVADEAR